MNLRLATHPAGVRHHPRAVVLAVLLAGLAAASAFAETPEEVFESLYGRESRRVAALPREAAVFAATLLDGAGRIPDSPDLAALLCRKAFEFAIKDKSGADTAFAALEALEKLDAKALAEIAEKAQRLSDLLQRTGSAEEKKRGSVFLLARLAAAGDDHLVAGKPGLAAEDFRRAALLAQGLNAPEAEDLQAKMKAALHADRLAKEIDRQMAALALDPGNVATAKKLVLLLLVEADAPSKAGEWVAISGVDDRFRANLAAAARPEAELDENAALNLGQWYRGLAAEATPVAKPLMLARARGGLDRYLQLHTAPDIARLKAKKAYDEVAAEIDKIAAAGVVFKGSDLAADFPRGKGPDGKVNAGAWIFGWAPANKLGDFKPYEKLAVVPGESVAMAGSERLPAVWRNMGKGLRNGVAPGEVSFHGGPSQEMSIARWTSPVNGKVRVAGAFGAGNSGTVDVSIVKVSRGEVTVLAKKAATATAEPFDLVVPVRAGDKLDFIVGTAGTYYSDDTPLAARITLAR